MNTRRLLSSLLVLVMTCVFVPLANAGLTDIDNAPLITENGDTAVLPNLMFVLDDSGSMSFDYLPDYVNDGYCRASGAGLSQSNYAGTFNLSCCPNSNFYSSGSNACWTGSAPFGTFRGQPLFLSSDFNGVAYNPAITYTPPINADGSSMASQNSTATGGWTVVYNDAYRKQNTGTINLLTQFPDTEWCTSTSYDDCLRNDNYVLPGTVNGKSYTVYHPTVASGTGYVATGAPDSATTASRSFGPYYYQIVPGEYCDSASLRNCQTAQNSTYSYPATVRWCNSSANARAATPAAGTCQALQTSTYRYIRYPTTFFTGGTPEVPATPASTTFTVQLSGCSNNSRKLSVTAVTVNGTNLLASSTSYERWSSSLAADIASEINNKSGTTHYTATATGSSQVTITAPFSAGAVTYPVSFATSSTNSNCKWTTSAGNFGGYNAGTPGVAAGFYGQFKRVDIVPSQTSYPRAATRSDCAGATCSYAEEMTNFANWWTYYHTRMQMMKSSAATAFSGVSSRYRVGYISINNQTSSDFLNLDAFTGTQKTNWFAKLRNAIPGNSTPLRIALAKVGHLYAGQLDGTSVNGSTARDPMQYSCQRNYTLLSTDGYWNESSTPTQIDGSSIGDQDSALTRPMLDANATPNTLSDVAAYYYNTDIRNSSFSNCTGANGSGTDVCEDNVRTTPSDPLQTQHMSTYTLGLGESGYMQYRSDYASATSGDFYAVKNGLVADTTGGVCAWQASGSTCNWPIPVGDTLTAVDDLWHAAVNGHGQYFSARNPAELYNGISSALSAIDSQEGAAAAATASNPNVSEGDNYVFVSDYMSGVWTGELKSVTLNTTSGDLSETDTWTTSAQAQLGLRPYTDRKIYTAPSSSGTTARALAWSNLSSSEQQYFKLGYIDASGQALSQFCTGNPNCLSSTSQSDAAGEKLLNFILGDRSNEGPVSDPSTYFRQRTAVLGDIVDSQVSYVRGALANYTDAGYSTYKSDVSTRQAMLYVGANDGMLHAFKAADGSEAWAYVPKMLLPKLYKLADKDYGNRHSFYVDGTPVAADVLFGSDNHWHTILVGGLGAGGRGYYALDVTDPAEPKALWEFTDNNLGYSYGRPVVAKLADGTWTVMFGSGYNNVSPGDGHGRLYVLNAETGSVIRSIDTAVGDPTTPSGLVGIRAWIDSADTNNTAARVYAGDNLGNVWRFDVNDSIAPGGYEAHLLATLHGPSGVVEPITSRPELGLVSTTAGSVAMVYVGTGRYLGLSDLSDTSVQTMYAIKDPLDGTNYGNPRDSSRFIQQTLTDSTCPAGSSFCTAGQKVRVGTGNPVDLATDYGWYVDMPNASERLNTDPELVLGTLVFTSNIVTSSVCSASGSSFLNYLDYRSGAPVSVAGTLAGVQLSNNALATSEAIVEVNNKIEGIGTLSTGAHTTNSLPIQQPSGTTRRVLWRELNAN